MPITCRPDLHQLWGSSCRAWARTPCPAQWPPAASSRPRRTAPAEWQSRVNKTECFGIQISDPGVSSGHCFVGQRSSGGNGVWSRWHSRWWIRRRAGGRRGWGGCPWCTPGGPGCPARARRRGTSRRPSCRRRPAPPRPPAPPTPARHDQERHQQIAEVYVGMPALYYAHAPRPGGPRWSWRGAAAGRARAARRGTGTAAAPRRRPRWPPPWRRRPKILSGFLSEIFGSIWVFSPSLKVKKMLAHQR